MQRLLAKSPLSWILIVSFVTQISAAVGLTAWLSIRNGQRAVNEVASQLREETSTRIDSEVDDLLSTTQVVNDLSIKTIQRENLDLTNIRAVEDVYWDYINTFQTILGVGVGNINGDILAMFRRIENGETLFFLEYSNSATQGKYVSSQLDKQRQVVQSRTIDRRIDARERPWYKAAIAAAGPVWTDVYTSVSAVEGHSLAINASQPVYTSDGRLQGVASVILDLGQVSQLLEAIEPSPSGQVFIIEASGDLIGSSDGKNPVLTNGDNVDRLPATQSNTPLIRETAVYLNTLFDGNLSTINETQQLEFELAGERQYLQVTPLRTSDQLPWLIVVAVPESDFMGQINANTRNTIGLCLAALVLAIGSSVLTARWVTRPLLQLNQATKDIAQGNLQPTGAIAPARTQEVSELADSFMQMAQQLNDSFTALQASEANFRNVADNLPGAVFRYILRPDGTDAVLYMSPGCYELWEVDARTVEQDATVLWEMIHPEDASILQALVIASAQAMQRWFCEWRITTPSGQRKWLQGIGQPTRQADGAVLWHSVILDVSDRKQAELDLKVQRDFNELIANITSRFVDLSPANLDAEIEQALQEISEVIGVDTSYVFQLDETAQTFSMSHEWSLPTVPRKIEQAQNIPFSHFPWSLGILKQRELIYVPQLADLPDAAAVDRAHWQAFNVVAILIIPLVQKSKVTGFMGFASFSQPIQWEDDSIRLLRVMGQTIANAQENIQTQIALIESEARWQFALEGSGDGVWDWNAATNEVFFSRQWKTMLGYEEHEIGNTLDEWDSRIHPEDRDRCYEDLERHFTGQTPIYQNEHRMRGKDNTYRWILDRGKVIEWTADGKPLRVIGTHTDVTERKRAANRLQDLSERLALAIQAADMGIWEWDMVNDQLYWDERMFMLYNLRPEEISNVKEAWEASVHPGDFAAIQAMEQRVQAGAEDYEIEFRILWPDGTIRHIAAFALVQRDAEGNLWRIVGANLDISDRKQAEEQLIYSALHDALTDLPNRTLLTSRLELAIQRTQHSQDYHFAVLFLDLDQFKVINDSLGHLIGDELLLAVAHKLRSIVRPADLAARLGGDEFVILLEDVPDIPAVIRMAERLLAEFDNATEIDGHSVFITTSIGIAWGTSIYTEASDLLRDADIALYQAKAQGRGRYEIFNSAMHTQAVKRMTLERDLRIAIAQQEFVPYYQPIIDLKTQRLTGFEVLIRWCHPVRGLVSPTVFIPVAEETGLIGSISQWVLQTACEQVATWQRQFPGLQNLKVSVNLSGQDLRQTALVDQVYQILRQTQLPASSLTLEITESMLIDNIETTIDLLERLRDLGVRISIDDFGTGYSSLSYLYNLPADYLKIDQSFVGKMQPGNKNYKIVQAVVSLSDQLELVAIAEGIETMEQLHWLRELGCELGQGYWFSRPLPPAAAQSWLSSGRLQDR